MSQYGDYTLYLLRKRNQKSERRSGSRFVFFYSRTKRRAFKKMCETLNKRPAYDTVRGMSIKECKLIIK